MSAINCRLLVGYILVYTMIDLTCDAIPSAMPLVYRKTYTESLPLTCPGCHSDIDECSIRINTTTGATLQNGSLILRPRDWGVYGTICCGGIDQESQCYHICPQHPESCQDCLMLSANVTATTAVGDVVMITSGMAQQPHNGVSLLVNGLISTNPNFECSTTSHVLGRQVIFYCTARKSGTVTIQSNVVFCDGDLTSQQINITIEEQGTAPNETHSTTPAVPSTTSASTTPPQPSTTTTTPLATVTTDKTNNTVSINTTVPIVPNDAKSITAIPTTTIIATIISIVIHP